MTPVSRARSGGTRSGEKPARRVFGSIRQLPSGRFQARYIGPDGHEHKAPVTFDAFTDADGWLTVERASVIRGDWKPPQPEYERHIEEVSLTFGDYVDDFLERRKLRPTTRELYSKLLGRIRPTFEADPLDNITPRRVQRWYASMATTPTTQANAYSLLRTILAAAVEDDLLARNPCRVRGGSVKRRAKEPETLHSVSEVNAYLAAVPPRYRPALSLAVWLGLRSGEVRGMRRRDLDLDKAVVHVRQGAVKISGVWTTAPPKTAAGVRDVAIPPHLVPELRAWLDEHPPLADSDLLFTARDRRTPLPDQTLRDAHRIAAKAVGHPALTLHGLRHTHLTIVARAGATTAELMARAGHTAPTMALRYQHAASSRDQELAQKLSSLAEQGEPTPTD